MIRLTPSSGPPLSAPSRRHRVLTLLAVAAGMAGTFALDWFTSTAGVQHLYYLPIIVAARVSGVTGALLTAATAIVLYHAANPRLLGIQYRESDFVQIALFIAVGLV